MDSLRARSTPDRSPETHSGQSHRMYGAGVTENPLWYRFRFWPRPRGAVRALIHSVFHGGCAQRVGARLGQLWHAVYQRYTDNGAVLPVRADIVGLWSNLQVDVGGSQSRPPPHTAPRKCFQKTVYFMFIVQQPSIRYLPNGW